MLKHSSGNNWKLCEITKGTDTSPKFEELEETRQPDDHWTLNNTQLPHFYLQTDHVGGQELKMRQREG